MAIEGGKQEGRCVILIKNLHPFCTPGPQPGPEYKSFAAETVPFKLMNRSKLSAVDRREGVLPPFVKSIFYSSS